MASYSAVIDLRVTGLDSLKAVQDRVAAITNLTKQLKPIPTLFDQRASAEVKAATKDLSVLVEQYAKGYQKGQQFASSIAGLNAQIQAFNTVAANANTKSMEFGFALKAAAEASAELFSKELQRLSTLQQLYERQPGAGKQPVTAYGPSSIVKELLDTGKAVPNTIAGLEAYRNELSSVQRLVGQTSQEFKFLQEAINKVDVQLGRAQFGPELPPGGVKPKPKPKGGGMPAAQGPTSPVNPLARESDAFENLALGAGFPLLFGGGPGSVAGGLLGSFVGQGFGGQILGSAIGQIIDEAITKVKELSDAINQLNMDKFRESAILVTAELEDQIRLLKEAGDIEGARALMGGAVKEQTGMSGEGVDAIGNAVQMLKNSWDGVYATVSNLVGFIAAPFAVGLSKVLDFTNMVGKGWNLIADNLLGGIFRGLGITVDKHRAINEETEKQKAALMAQERSQYRSNIELKKSNDLAIAIEQARQAGNDKLAEEYSLVQKVNKIEEERKNKIKEIREKYAGQDTSKLEAAVNSEAKLKTLHEQRLSALNQIKIAYKEQVAEIRHAAALEQKNVDIAKNQVSKFAQLAQARSQAELTVNNALLQRLNYELQGTTNAQDRIKIAKKIYQTELANARVTYVATMQQIEAQIIQVELEKKAQELKAETLQVELALARQKKQDTKELERALQLQGKAIAMARDNVFLTGAIAIEQRRGAEATFKAAEFAAKVNFEQNAVAKASAETASSTGVIANNLNVAAAGAGVLRDSTQGAAVAAAEYAENIRKAAVNSAQMVKANLVQLAQQARAASRVGLKQEGEGPAGPAVNTATYARGGYSLGALSDKFLGRAFSERGGSSDTIFMSYVQKIKQLEAIKRYEEDLAAYKEYQKYGIDVPKPVVPLAARSYAKRGGMTAYAEGGFVTRPTNALIGEGGEAEYVIPASKMSEAMARYSAGARGSSVIPDGVNPQVNITTGPVTQMNGTNYVTQRDLMYATETAAREGAAIALKSLRSNPATRRSVGLAR